MLEWKPIETAPKDTKRMFVVIAINPVQLRLPYKTDPYCVWAELDKGFVRWPHTFPPTHWCELPSIDEFS